MKKRVFYVVNLDRSRMWILALLLVSTLLFAFATGFRVGQAQAPQEDTYGDTRDADDSLGARERPARLNGESPDSTGELELAELRRTTGSAEFAGPVGSLDDTVSLSRLDAPDSRKAGQKSTTELNDSVGSSPFEKNPADRPVRLSSLARVEPTPKTAKKTAQDKSPRKTPSHARKTTASQSAKRSNKQTAQAPTKRKSKKTSTARPAPDAKQQSKPRAVAAQTNTKDTHPRSALLNTQGKTLRLANVSAGDRKPETNKPTRAAPVPPRKKAQRSYSLQLGAFSSRAAADRMAGSLKKQGFHPRIEKSRGRHIVRVGRSDTARGLWKLEQGLRQKKYAPMRVSTNRK